MRHVTNQEGADYHHHDKIVIGQVRRDASDEGKWDLISYLGVI